MAFWDNIIQLKSSFFAIGAKYSFEDVFGSV